MRILLSRWWEHSGDHTGTDLVALEKKLQAINSVDTAGKRSCKDFCVRDIARSTSAAPVYFEPVNIQTGDQSV